MGLVGKRKDKDLALKAEHRTPNAQSITPSLGEALNLGDRELISLVGAGGKTTLMFALARELKDRGFRVVTTTTTKIFYPTAEETPLVLLGDAGLLPEIDSALARNSHVTWAARQLPENKLSGVSLEDLSLLWSSGITDYLVVEADGSARRPLKAPNEKEPVVPPETSLFITVAGLSVLGKPLNDQGVFRSEIVSKLTGIALDEPITPAGLISLITHPRGGLKGWLPGMRIMVFLNQADEYPALEESRGLAKKILSKNSRIEKVILGRLTTPAQKYPQRLDVFD
jgi:probable selenium-dependent hydroxylase accessory protein YqeC